MKTTFQLFQFLFFISLTSFLVSCGSDDEAEEPVVDCSVSNLSVAITSTTKAWCDVLGTIEVAVTGGEGSITYSLDGTNFQSATTFEGLEAGNYIVTAKDSNDCISTASATVEADSLVEFTTTEEDSGCGTTQGTITVTATGGDGSYQYSIDGGSFGDSNVFSSLGQGDYTVAVKDGGSCNESSDVAVLSGTSLSTHIQPIITLNCAVTGCHVSGGQSPNFSMVANIMANADRIKVRTGAGTMPPSGRSITQEQIDLIDCWVNDGGLNN